MTLHTTRSTTRPARLRLVLLAVVSVLGLSNVGHLYAQSCAAVQLTQSGQSLVASNFGSVFSGDYNHDGFTDMVMVVPFSQPLQLVFGDGAGGLAPAVAFDPGYPPINVDSGDFNGDGFVDLVIGTNGSHVILATSNGLGTFTVALDLDVSSTRSYVSAGDLTGDGALDFVVTRQTVTGPSSVRLYAGDGIGGFAAPVDIISGHTPEQLDIADYNSDGVLDLAVGNTPVFNGPASLNVHFGTMNGGVGPTTPVTLVTTNYGAGFTSADVNGDGVRDFAVLEFVPTTICGLAVTTHLSAPGGGYAFGQQMTGGCGPYSPRFADYNGDGAMDLTYTDGGDFVAAANWLQVHPGDGSGVFGAPCMAITGTWSIGRYSTADLNGDLRPDWTLADFSSGGVTAYLNTSQTLGSDFVRGDCNDDASTNLADAVRVLNHLFPTGSPMALPCEAACDANDDDSLNLADAVAILNALFGVPPAVIPAPTSCGPDPTPGIDCGAFAGCP